MINSLDYTLYYIVQLTSTAHSPEDSCRNILGHSYADAPALHYHNAIPYYICMGIGINIKSYADIVKEIKQKREERINETSRTSSKTSTVSETQSQSSHHAGKHARSKPARR